MAQKEIGCEEVSTRMMEPPLWRAVGREPCGRRGPPLWLRELRRASWRPSRPRGSPPAARWTRMRRPRARTKRSCAPRPRRSRPSNRSRSRRAPFRRGGRSGSGCARAGRCRRSPPSARSRWSCWRARSSSSPTRPVELGRQALRETPAAAPAAPPTEAAAQPEAQEKARTTAQGAASERKKEISLDLAERPAADKELARSVAAPPAHHRRAAPADGFGALDGLTKGGGSAGPARAKAPALDDLIRGKTSRRHGPRRPSASSRRHRRREGNARVRRRPDRTR